MRIGVSLEIVVRLFLSLFADLSFPLLAEKRRTQGQAPSELFEAESQRRTETV
jgi:hypothetical protein